MKGISTSKKNLCPVCGNHHGCKIQEDKWVLCLRGSSQQDAPPGYRFIKPLRNGMGGLFGINNGAHSDGAWQDRIDRINQRRQREREATARLLGTEELGIEERARQYQAVVTQLGLSQQHSQTLLERGLTQTEIQQAGFRSWEPGKRVTDATSQLTGIDSKGEYLLGARGIFIPAYDSWGNITGAQLKTDSNRPGKYIWLSSCKEDGTGKGPHLPGGELPLFVWRHSESQQVSLVILCEGALKSAITAFLLWRMGLTNIAVIGTAAGGFFGSDTLKAYLEQLAPQRVQLAPDAGSINNTSNIPAANQQTIKQCQDWGFSVDILWWGQTHKKQHLDIDELLTAGRWGEVQAISPDEFFQLHPVATREKLENHTPQSTGNSEHRSNELDADAYSQYLKLEDEQKRVERVEQEVRGFGKVKQFLKRLLPKRLPFELPPPKKLPEVLRYAPGNLPCYGKVENYPKILYTSEQLPQLLIEAREKRWRDILDSSGTGIGKSHRYATLSPFTLGVEDEGRAWLLSQSHRNPTTAPAKHNYSDMPVRTRTGFVEDSDRKTATGSPYKRYPTEEEAKSLHNGNCHMADLIHAVAAKGIKDAQEEAQYNPFCTFFCKHKDYCGEFTGPGFGYRSEQRQLFENNYQIGASIESLSEPSNYPYERDVAILDEPLQQLKPVQVIKADTTDIATQWDELEYQLPQVAKVLAPLRTALASLVRGVDLPYQGLNHEQLLALLPPVLEDFTDTLERIRVAMAVALETLAGDVPDTASTQEEGERVTSLKAKIKRRSEKLAKLQTELIELQNIEDDLLHTVQQLSLEDKFWEFKYTSAEAKRLLERLRKLPDAIAELEIELAQLRSELDQQEQDRQTVKKFNRRQYQEAKQSLKGKIEALPNQWLVPFLEVWSGSSSGALRINPHGSLLATVVNCRHNRILNRMKTRYYLDATATPEMLALYRQIPVAQILQIEQEIPPLENLNFVWVTGLGLAGKNRSDSCDERLKNLHSFLKEKHPDLVTFDWKAKKEVLGADGHYFSDSTRGTNEFISRTAIAAIGLPMPDIATFYDLWLTTKTDGSLSFDDFYRQLVDAEIIQEVGRLRANRRPDEKLTFYLIGDTEKCRVANYQPPAQLKPKQIEVRKFCPAAASKSEQAWLGIWEVLQRWWSEHGELPTQAEVSQQTGIDRSWISKLAAQFSSGWKCLKKIIQSLVDPPYSRWNLIDSFPKDFEWLAKTFLPLVVQQPSLEVAQELNSLLQIYGWRGWVQILSQTTQTLQLNLIAALFRDAFPDWRKKSDLSSPKIKAAGLV